MAWPIELRTHPRAKSMRLRLDEARELLVLTVPGRMSRRAALQWAGGQASWVEAQLGKLQPSEPLRPGAAIPFEGRDMRLSWDPGLPRSPAIVGDVLQCGGPIESFATRVERFLRSEARDRLGAATRDLAHQAGVTVCGISVGDARSRWGSCSASGAIRYNWRIVLAPPHLLRWLVAHEVAHRRHMNHGPRFRTLEAELYGGNVPAARAELRALGPRLKRVGLRV